MDIFKYSDYREYVRAWLEQARKTNLCNLSRLAEAAQVHTTFLSNVLSGKKNLSLEQATLISETMGHTTVECDYFFSLIEIERAGSVKLKTYWKKKKENLEAERKKIGTRVGEHHELTDAERAIYYSSWIYSAIFAATDIEGGQSLDQVAGRFALTREQAEKFLSFLVSIGVCDFSDNRYKMGQNFVFVPNDSPFVVKHHINWRMKAVQKMDTRSPSELFFSAPISISNEDFNEIRELLAQAIQKSMAICKDSVSEDVACLNIDLFKIKN